MCHLPPGTENRCVPGLGGGGGGAAAHITAATGRRGASKGAMRDAAGGGGGGGGWDKLPGGILGGGYDGTNTLAASPGGRGGQTPWRHPPGGGGGWDKHPGATPLPQPDEECESCRGKGGEG